MVPSQEGQEMYIFEYGFRKVYMNSALQAYLEDLRKTYKSVKSNTIPFASFVSYCQNELGIREQDRFVSCR